MTLKNRISTGCTHPITEKIKSHKKNFRLIRHRIEQKIFYVIFAKIVLNLFPNCDCVHTIVWMLLINTNKTHCEKSRREPHKNTTSYFEQIQEATPPRNNTCTVTYLLSKKNPNKTSETRLEKYEQIHKQRSSFDPYTWTWLCCLTSKTLFTSALCGHRMLFGRPVGSDERERERERERESWVHNLKLRWQCCLMMMMMMIYFRFW